MSKKVSVLLSLTVLLTLVLNACGGGAPAATPASCDNRAHCNICTDRSTSDRGPDDRSNNSTRGNIRP